MRRYTININNVPHVVDVEEITADTFQVQYEDQTLQVTLDGSDDLAQASITPGVTASQARELPKVASPAPRAAAPAAAAAAAPAPAAAPAAAGGPGLTAPMPGVVLEISAAVGQKVSKGDELLVLEAMKMKNSLFADRDAVVKAVHVTAGQQVKYGEMLVSYEGA